MTHLEHNEGRIPFEDIMPIFGKVATMAELSKMSSDERRRYEDSEDLYLSNLAAWDYNYEKGIDKGWIEGKAEGLAEGLAEGEARGLAKGEARGLAKGEARGLAKGEARGLAKGKAEGEAKKAVEIARALKKQGLPVEMISACTGLPVEEVVKLMTN